MSGIGIRRARVGRRRRIDMSAYCLRVSKIRRECFSGKEYEAMKEL